jgi:hypothetical protein
MARVLFYLLILLVVAALGGVIYALVADLPAPVREIEIELPGAALE